MSVRDVRADTILAMSLPEPLEAVLLDVGVRGLTNFHEGDRSIWLTGVRRELRAQLGSGTSEA